MARCRHESELARNEPALRRIAGEALDEEDRKQQVQSRRGRRYRNREGVSSFWWSDVGSSDDHAFRRRQQKERRARALGGALLILLLRIRAALIGLGLRDAARVVCGMAVGLDSIRALTFDAAVVTSLRGRLPAGTRRDARAEEGQDENRRSQPTSHWQLRVSHRNALSRADLPNETNCCTAAGRPAPGWAGA